MNKREKVTKLAGRLGQLSHADLEIVTSAVVVLEFAKRNREERPVDNSAFPTSESLGLQALFDMLRIYHLKRPEELKQLNGDDETQLDLTKRGTPRIRRKYRSREEIGGDPHKEEHKLDVKLGGRVPRDLRDRFVELANREFPTQSAALTEAIAEFVQKYQHDID